MDSLIADLTWRGLVNQVTDPSGLAESLDAGALTGYIGFDPTADSLHVGHLQQICLLRRFRDAGHRPVALIGGGTGMIGDPSGKSEERNLLDAATLGRHRDAIAAQLGLFVDFTTDTASGGALLVDNSEWLAEVGLLEFLRDVGKVFSVNEMIRKESVRSRLEGRDQSLSFTEFSYMLLQSWDFVQLFDRYDCRLQLGGSDQWGNITEGVDLLRRLRGTRAFGLTSPLVTKADGTKFGKTESGAVWLSAAKTSPYAFFQFWMRTADAEVDGFLRRLTFLDRTRIEELQAADSAHPEKRTGQRELAREITTLVHGVEAAGRAERAAEILFTEGVVGLDEATLAEALADAPGTTLTAGDLAAGVSVVDALVACGLAPSKGQARQLLATGSVSVNNRKVETGAELSVTAALHGRWILLRRGRATQAVILVEA